MNNVANTLLATLLCGAFASANAHQIWIEQDGKRARVVFGEFAENLRELSPGRLDKFVALTGTIGGWVPLRVGSLVTHRTGESGHRP